MSDEDEAEISKENTPEVLPILPLRNTVLFPVLLYQLQLVGEDKVKLLRMLIQETKQ